MATHPQLCGPSRTVTDTPLPLAPPADQRTRTLSSEVPASSADTSQSSCPNVSCMEINRPPTRCAPLLPSPCPTLRGPQRRGPVSVCLSVYLSSLSPAGSTVVTQYQGQGKGPYLVVGDKRRTGPPSESSATPRGEMTPLRL